MKRSWSSPIIVVVLYQLLGVASAKQPAVSYSGGDGSSVAKAVVIKAPHEEFGVKAEYTFIQIHYGRYETVSQGVSHEKKRTYDIIIFRTPDRKKHTIYFDITDFFGKGFESFKNTSEPKSDGPPRGDVIKFGLIKSVSEEHRYRNPNTLDGQQTTASDPKFAELTSRVPAKLGTTFGFWFLLSGIAEPRSVELTKLVKHPRMKNAKGRDEVQYTTTYTRPVTNGMVFAGAAYRLEQVEELKPGTWTFEIFYHDKKLVSQSFTVYPLK